MFEPTKYIMTNNYFEFIRKHWVLYIKMTSMCILKTDTKWLMRCFISPLSSLVVQVAIRTPHNSSIG